MLDDIICDINCPFFDILFQKKAPQKYFVSVYEYSQWVMTAYCTFPVTSAYPVQSKPKNFQIIFLLNNPLARLVCILQHFLHPVRQRRVDQPSDVKPAQFKK